MEIHLVYYFYKCFVFVSSSYLYCTLYVFVIITVVIVLNFHLSFGCYQLFSKKKLNLLYIGLKRCTLPTLNRSTCPHPMHATLPALFGPSLAASFLPPSFANSVSNMSSNCILRTYPNPVSYTHLDVYKRQVEY